MSAEPIDVTPFRGGREDCRCVTCRRGEEAAARIAAGVPTGFRSVEDTLDQLRWFGRTFTEDQRPPELELLQAARERSEIRRAGDEHR